MERRKLLQLASYGALGLCAGGAGTWVLGAGRSRVALPVTLGALEDFPLDSARVVAAHDVLVLRDARGLAFISTRCTHLGCRVRVVGSQLVCPCHAGRFTLEGKVISGPPPAPLARLEGGVSQDGRVYVFTQRVSG